MSETFTREEAIEIIESDGIKVKRRPDEEFFALHKKEVCDIDGVGKYVPEDQDPNVLVKGRWLERGGSAWWVSTAGTGKSIAATQLSLMWSEGLPFAGLHPTRKLTIWVFQSEDSPTRVAIDREDITAELAEKHPEVDWTKARKKVKFVKFHGKVGTAWLEALDALLADAEAAKCKPDVIIINPFLAFIGGPVNDGSYVTPFLRGGEINRKETCGLQDILERYGVGALIFHHTPKPPKADELDAWMKSAFPEYQGAGSADITNWGRSFVTMMKVKDHPEMVCLTAGKNGNELGWQVVGGARRHYLAYSGEGGVSGLRHAWRELTDEEFQEVAKCPMDRPAECLDAMVAFLKEHASSFSEVFKTGRLESIMPGFSRNLSRRTWNEISRNPEKFGLVSLRVFPDDPVKKAAVIGTEDGARSAVQIWSYNYKRSVLDRRGAEVPAPRGTTRGAEVPIGPLGPLAAPGTASDAVEYSQPPISENFQFIEDPFV